MMTKGEVYTDREFNEIKKIFDKKDYRERVRKQLKRIFTIYNANKDHLLDDVVGKMVSGGSDGQPKAPNFDNKSERLMLDKLAAEEFVEFVDKLMSELDEQSYDIIDLVYVDGSITNEEIYGEILVMSHRDYYRKKWIAEHKLYKKIRKNYDFFKSWH